MYSSDDGLLGQLDRRDGILEELDVLLGWERVSSGSTKSVGDIDKVL